MPDPQPQHVVFIVGGAVAGSEAAYQLAQRGILCIVLEQNDRPYGKIEDGLPRWHVHLRRQEEKKIDDKLADPGVVFVPRTKLERDLNLAEILRWGPSGVVLATGAWRDRPFPVPDIDRFVGHGFFYQNPLIYWFNHYPEPGYEGPRVAVADGALVVGGGLASLDVVKVLMLETVIGALASRGHDIPLYELEHLGVARVLGDLGLTLTDLQLKGCTLIYRRQVEEMPLAEVPKDATPQQVDRAHETRRKLLRNFADKYLFTYRERRVPVGYLAEGGRLTGLTLATTGIMEGRVNPVKGSEYEMRSPMVVSSIGSIPEPIQGVEMRGSRYRVKDDRSGELEGLAGVFAVGNAVTGRGNILISQKHGRAVSQNMLEHYLMGIASGYEEVLTGAAVAAQEKAEAMAVRLAGRTPLPASRVSSLLARVKTLQDRVSYPGTYREWIERVRPPEVL